MDSIKNQIKIILIQQGYKLTEIVEEINKRFNKKDTVQNLNNKLSKGTIRYTEILEIAETLGYDLVWVPKRFRSNFTTMPIYNYLHYPDDVIGEIYKKYGIDWPTKVQFYKDSMNNNITPEE